MSGNNALDNYPVDGENLRNTCVMFVSSLTYCRFHVGEYSALQRLESIQLLFMHGETRAACAEASSPYVM